MTEKSEIAVTVIAEALKEIMKNKGLTSYQLEQKGINKQQIYSVLRMGNVKRPNYSIETFIEVLGAIGVHLELHDLGQKSNLDLDKSRKN